MGNTGSETDETPVHTGDSSAFYIDLCVVANAQHKKFAELSSFWYVHCTVFFPFVPIVISFAL